MEMITTRSAYPGYRCVWQYHANHFGDCFVLLNDFLLIGRKGDSMAGTVPEAAQLDSLTNFITNALTNCKMHLVSSNFTPGVGTTLASLAAIEATFTGYSAATLSTWSAAAIDGTTAAITTSTQGQFTGTSGGGTGNLYGYYLTDSSNTKFYGCEKFASAPISELQNITLEIDCTYSLITRF